jgi:uncharacterized protein (TIGR03437 family)
VRSGCGLFCALWAAALACAQSNPGIPAPLYTSSSIVNAAHPDAPGLSANTIASLYGKDLSFTTAALTGDQVRAGVLPSVLIGAGVKVTVNGIAAALYYVSPGQINFLMPDIRPGQADVRVMRDGLYGQVARVAVGDYSPALFPMDPEFAIAARADASVITRDAPARPGEIVVLYATGLGLTRPRMLNGEVATRAATLDRMDRFTVSISGRILPAANVLYAGIAPGFAGLYQINLRMPADFDPDPVIRIGFGEILSPEGIRLHADPRNP